MKILCIFGLMVVIIVSPLNTEAMVKNKHRLASLEPKFRAKIVELVAYLEKKYPHDQIVISSTYRTFAEQDALYARGRKVTNAKGGESKHNFGKACDLYFIKDGKIRPFCPRYFVMGKYAKKLGLVWGGDFKSIKDWGHLEDKI